MKRKSMFWLAVAAFIVYLGLMTLYSFPKLEKKLDKLSSSVGSFTALENSDLEWQGRNGYLTVPEDIDKSIAELAASDIEGIQGVRDVKVIYDDARVKPKAEAKAEEKVKDEKKEKAKDGKFKLDWTGDDRKIVGEFNKSNADALHNLFGVDILKFDSDASIKDKTMKKLEQMEPDLFSSISQGALEVDGDKIKVSGIAKETADIEGLKSKWDALGGVDMDINMSKAEKKNEQALMLDADYEFDYLYFKKGESVLVAKSAKAIDEIADVLNEYKDVQVDIVGHTDNWGSNSDNLKLSEQRAEAVKSMLADKGIDESRMTVLGKGEHDPIADNGTILGREKNRRVEIHVKENN